MENFKFEALVTGDSQLRKLEECVEKIPNINNWQIKEYRSGTLLSVNAANIRGLDIVLALQKHGFVLELFYEE